MCKQPTIVERFANLIETFGTGNPNSNNAQNKRILDNQFYQNGHASAPVNAVAAMQAEIENNFHKPAKEHFDTCLADQSTPTPRRMKTIMVSGSSMQLVA